MSHGGAVNKRQQPPNEHISPSEFSGGDRAMFGTDSKLPIVMCPGCDEPMKAIERKPVAFSNGLVDVTFVCETCLTHTIRTIKADDKGLL
jgi:hypothetical protein